MKIFIQLKFSSILVIWLIIIQSCEKKNDCRLPIDFDGNYYDTVVIGNQTWFKENLKTTKYNNGDPIYLVSDNIKWSNFPAGAYCWYDNNQTHKDTYGALYNWKAVTSGLLCPDGWHAPSQTEWEELIAFLGGRYDGGGKLKEIGSTHWISQSERTTNESGFTALPGGYRYLDGTFHGIREIGCWWMSDYPYFERIIYSTSSIGYGSWYVNAGCSVRCIKD